MSFGSIKSGKQISIKDGHFPQLYIGLDAQKPTPGPGDFAITTDTNRQYICYVAGYWSLIWALGYDEMSSHTGAVIAWNETGVNGNGTAVSDSTNHEMDLSTGITVAGHALFQQKTFLGINARSLCQFKINNIVIGLGAGINNHRTLVGFSNDFTVGLATAGFAGFVYDDDDLWYTMTIESANITRTLITSLVDGDVVGVLYETTHVDFFKNGSYLCTHTTNIPDPTTMGAGVCVLAEDAGLTGAQKVSVDGFMVRLY